jgi:hypothetical protein
MAFFLIKNGVEYPAKADCSRRGRERERETASMKERRLKEGSPQSSKGIFKEVRPQKQKEAADNAT